MSGQLLTCSLRALACAKPLQDEYGDGARAFITDSMRTLIAQDDEEALLTWQGIAVAL